MRFHPRPAPRPEAGSALLIGAVAGVAHLSGIELLMFPELGALAHDIAKRPYGAWASAPLMLVLTPLLTAAIGVAIAHRLDFGMTAVLLDVLASMMVIGSIRSPVAPAISAGLLPLVLGVHSWWYPLSVSFGTVLLALLSIVQRRFREPPPRPAPRDAVDDLMEAAPSGLAWLTPFLLLIALLALLGQWSGRPFILFPPLVVIGFEMFAHPRACPWIVRPWRLPVACTLGALAGVWAVGLFGTGPAAAMLAMAAGALALRLLDLHAPPVLAVGLLPMVMPHPGYDFVAAVLAGTVALVLWFALWQAVGLRRRVRA